MNIVIWGTGSIADKMASTILELKDIKLHAVISRSKERAREFATKYNIPNHYLDDSSSLQDPEIDLVYIATPHSEHYQNTKTCLSYRKNVLCEKPLTVNANQAKELFALAKTNNRLLTEAMWTRYAPSRYILEDLLEQNLIGTISSITANLGYPLEHVKRMVDPSLAGGALLDLTVYPIHFATMAAKSDVKNITAAVVKDSNGIDLKDSISIEYENGITASLSGDMSAYTDRRAVISGSKGFLVFEPINNCRRILHYNDAHQLVKSYPLPDQITGYEYEVLACKDAIEQNRMECPDIPHEETIKVMEIMDQVRALSQITFPCE